MEDKSGVKVVFEGEMLEKVNALKSYYGVQSNAELIRILVKDRARQLKVEA
ncbi:MAG: hypothetical protein ACQCN6_01500 [Candidatus Bathyarchaeia archaeon]